MASLEILVKVHFGNDAELFRFQSVEKAASYLRDAHKTDPIEYVMEVEKDANGISHGFDRKEEFEKAWFQGEYSDALDAYHDQPSNHPDGISQDEFLYRAEGPTFCEGEAVKVSRGTDLIAAE